MENENYSKHDLLLRNGIGRVYFVASIIMILLVVVFTVLCGTISPFPYVWILAGLSIAYCLFILICEINRSHLRKKEQKKLNS